MARWRKNSLMMKFQFVLTIMILTAGINLQAQTRYIKEGNKLYEQQKYKEAAADYARAIAKDPSNTPGLFNYGNSLYQMKQYDSSRKVLATTAKVAKDKPERAAANYNIGNTYMSQQKWEDAVNSYKATLRNNPQDLDAKYNLSYAQQMLKKEQQQNKKDKKDQKNKDHEKNKQPQKQEGKDKQDKDADNQEKSPEPQKAEKQPQNQPSKLSEQQADQLLNALQQEERKLQDKMKKGKGAPVKVGKDW